MAAFFLFGLGIGRIEGKDEPVQPVIQSLQKTSLLNALSRLYVIIIIMATTLIRFFALKRRIFTKNTCAMSLINKIFHLFL